MVVLRLLIQFWFKGLCIIIWSRDNSSVSRVLVLQAQGPDLVPCTKHITYMGVVEQV